MNASIPINNPLHSGVVLRVRVWNGNVREPAVRSNETLLQPGASMAVDAGFGKSVVIDCARLSGPEEQQRIEETMQKLRALMAALK